MNDAVSIVLIVVSVVVLRRSLPRRLELFDDPEPMPPWSPGYVGFLAAFALLTAALTAGVVVGGVL